MGISTMTEVFLFKEETMDDFDMLLELCRNRKEKPMNNGEWIMSNQERFNDFFSLVAKADYINLKEKYNLTVDGDFHNSFHKWIVEEHKE